MEIYITTIKTGLDQPNKVILENKSTQFQIKLNVLRWSTILQRTVYHHYHYHHHQYHRYQENLKTTITHKIFETNSSFHVK